MEEEKEEEVKATGHSENASLTKELERIRGRHKVLKIVTALLSVFFIIILAAAAFIYHKIAGLRYMFAAAGNSFSESAATAQNLPLPRILSTAFSSMPLSTQSAASSLTMLTGLGFPPTDLSGRGPYAGVKPGFNPGFTAANAEKIMRAFSKYADRPIVKDFMEELKKDPDFKQALKEKDANNPAAMFSSLANTKSMERLAVKFALRPDFMPFMMEVMNNPQVKPLISQFSAYNKKPAPPTSKNMSGLQTVPVTPAAPPETVSGRQDANENAGISFDSSALEGVQKPSSVSLKKNAPPPISEE